MDIVERLRFEELQALRGAKRDDNIPHACRQLNERGRAQELVRQQYSGRYPFELLQNANDAAKELGLEKGRSAYFILTETALLVADDGAGFGEPQIRSICSLGDSSKGPGTAIGHKGLGFKSVGEITARPQVVSGAARFQFDGARVRSEVEGILGRLPDSQHFPVYAFPYELADEDLGDDVDEVRELVRQGCQTVVRLPFADDVRRDVVEGHLHDHLLPSLLLFLPSIWHLELRGTSHDFVATIEDNRDGAAWHARLTVDGAEERWLIYRDEFAPEKGLLEPLGEGWADIEAIHIGIAVPLDDSGQPRTDTTYPLNAYFPTEEYSGLRVSIHAEWILTLDRKHISDTPEAAPLNATILHQISDFVADTFTLDLVERFGSRESVHAVLPGLGATVTPGAGAELHELWAQSLARSAFVPTVSGTLQRPSDLRMLPARISDPDLAHKYASLDPLTSLRPDLEDVAALRSLIQGLASAAEMLVADYLERLKVPDRAELAGYYAFLMDCRASIGESFRHTLSEVSCVLTSHDAWIAPATETVFLPRARGEAAIPDDIPVPLAVVPDNVDDVEKFLTDLGVKPFQWRTIIEDYLMPLLRDPGTQAAVRDHALTSLRAYHQHRRGEEAPSVLADVLLPARAANGHERELRRSGDLYFDPRWTGSDDLATLYGPFNEIEFLDVDTPEDFDEKGAAKSFYEMLGVLDTPRVDIVLRLRGADVNNAHPHASPTFFEWLKEPDVAAVANGCAAGHPYTQGIKLSYQLDRLTDILESGEPRRLAALWRQLADHWDIYRPSMTATFRCSHSGHTGERDRIAPSLLAYILNSRAWIPTVRAGQEELTRPTDAWYDAPDTPHKILSYIPRVRSDLLDSAGSTLARALHLTDAARPGIDDLLTLLERLATDAEEAGEVDADLTYAARWVQRRLNERLHLDTAPHPEPQSVRLLTRNAGIKKFVAQPAYADDPLLRDAWEQVEPILVSDSQPRALARYLSLTNLDRTVTTVPRASGRHFPDSEADTGIRTLFNRRRPYILALICAENPSADEAAERRLRTLELLVCEELELRYVRDEIDIPRPDAPCYIDSRVERQGRANRRIGTAYLRLLPDTERHRPDWHAVANQLAEFLDVPALSDAIATILTASSDNRRSMLAQHSVERDDVRRST